MTVVTVILVEKRELDFMDGSDGASSDEAASCVIHRICFLADFRCENQVITIMKTSSLTNRVCKSCGGALLHCTQH